MSTFITRTPLTNMRPLGTDAERSHERVAAIIGRQLSNDHARLLAEPVPVSDGSAIDWYVDEDGDVLPLSALTAEEKAQVQATLDRQIADITAAADELGESTAPRQKSTGTVLRNAATFPSDNALWAIRTPGGLRPLLVGWGYAGHDAPVARAFEVKTVADPRAAAIRRERPQPAATAAGGGAIVGGAAAAGAGQAFAAGGGSNGNRDNRRGGFGWFWPLLSILAAIVMMGLIMALLLPACGLRTPFGTIAFGLPSQGCTIPEDETLNALAIQSDDLARELRIVEEDYRRRRLQCVPEEPVLPVEVVPPIEPMPEPEPIAEPLPEPDPAFEELIDDRGEFQVTLIWDGTDDLDLEVICPDGTAINYMNKQACNGDLDIDANGGSETRANPVENITFAEGLDIPGQYRVRINLYNSREGRLPLPFSVRIRDAQGERVIDGIARGPNDPVEITTFDK